MSVFLNFASQLKKILRVKSAGSSNRQKKYLSVYAAFILLLLGGVSFIVIKSGAQERESLEVKQKPEKFINQDVRLNNQANLNKILERNFDGGEKSLAGLNEKGREQAFKINEAFINLKKSNPTAEVTISPVTGALEILRSSGFLSKASRRDARYIALDFIQKNRELYGLDEADIANLHYVGESVNETSGLRLAIFEQKVNDRLVFQGELKISIDRDGRIIQSLGNLAPYATARASKIENLISPQEALVKTMATVDVALDVNAMSSPDSKADQFDAKIKVDDRQITGEVESKIVYFPVAPGIIIPAWAQVIWGKDADYYALVDAADGTLLFRKNIRSEQSTHQARFRVYVQTDGVTPADNPAPQSPSSLTAGFQPPSILPSIVSMLTAQNITASPNGWIDDCPGGVCGANQTQTLGNNALACLDRTAGATNVCDTAGVSLLDGNGRPTGNADAFGRNRDFLGTTARDFESTFLPAPQGGNPEAGQDSDSTAATVAPFLRGSVTHQFYVTNWYHDKLFALGFTPAARNFQINNFGGGGVGNDRVLVDVQDGQAVDNANFSTPPDGSSGRAQMFNFTGPVTTDRDGGLDAEILIHELTHGTSNRLVGNGSGLIWDVGAGMGEGWSDFYALSLLNNTNADDPNAPYVSGSYATYKAFGFTTYVDNYTYGIRRFPYSTVNTVNPLTWADVDDVTNNLSGGIAPSPLDFNGGGAMEVHNAGEIWANTLWEVRSRVIADPAGANGDVPTGNNTTLSIVTDAMRSFTPNNPSFIQGRDALIDADCAANAACPNELSIWGGFADRGLGYNAIAPLGYTTGWVAGHLGIGESFELPNLDVSTTTINDAAPGNGSGAIDPNERVRLIVNLKNPYRGAARNVGSATATLTSSTPGVTIFDDTAVYPAIAANGNSNPVSGDTFSFGVPLSTSCGSAIRFTLTINSALGVSTKNFILRVGAPSGTGAPITYTRNPTPDIAIPDNAMRGVGDSLTITDDFEIADLNFRADSISHLKVGDISVMLKAPNGYGADLLSLIGAGGFSGQNGDNITNMVIDQTAVAPNDQLTALSTQQPFTDDFLPIFNTPSWASLGLPQDPIGQMDRYNGMSTLGTWNLRVSDQRSVTTGTLNQWSIIVTPRAFACTFAPTAANVTVSGRVLRADGRAIPNVRIRYTDAQGISRSTITNQFGYFEFAEVEAGQTYLFQATAKGFNFNPQVLSVNDDLTDLTFTADE